MITILFAATLLFAGFLIVNGERTIRRLDRRYAEELPQKIDSARTEIKVRRRELELREHLKDEDLEFLAENGSPDAKTQLETRKRGALEAAKEARRRQDAIQGEIVAVKGRDIRVQAAYRTKRADFFITHGYFPEDLHKTRTYPRRYTDE